MDLHLPTLNAGLNAASAAFLTAGYIFIRRKNIPAHKLCMSLAFGTSVLFLVFYLTYHARHGHTRFPSTGGIRTLYLAILLTHTTLAVVILPMVIGTLRFAWQKNFERHRRLARWTWPLWMYVSVTGVVVYWMLYRLR